MTARNYIKVFTDSSIDSLAKSPRKDMHGKPKKLPSWVERAAVALMLAAAAVMFAGCAAYKPYEYHDDREEMPGPGLFSGENGVFTLYGKKSANPAQDAADPEEGDKDSEGKDLKAAP